MPSLGAAHTFALLAGSTVVSTGPSMIIGDVGVSPSSAIVGFPPATVTGGALHAADAPAAAAQMDLTTAYVDLAGQPCDTVLTGMDLGGMTLMPGVYCFSTSAQLTGTMFLDGMGDSNAVFIFQIGSTLTTSSTSAVIMIGSAMPGRTFWQVGSSATLGTGTAFSGNILAEVSITATSGSSIAGRALARTGAVTIDGVNGEAVATVGATVPPDAGAISLDAGSPPDGGTVPLDAGGAPDADVAPGSDAGVAPGADGGVVPGSDADVAAGSDAGDAGERGGLSGGAILGCTAVPTGRGGGAGAAFLLLGLLGVVAIRRRRGLDAIAIASLTLVAVMMPMAARADTLTLDQFHPPETSEDGLAVSRPVDLGHGRPSATLYLDYAHDPLVYEAVAGDANSERESIVDNQLAMHLGVAYGVFNRVVVFGGLSTNLAMTGEGRAGYVAADGGGIGDLTVGARVRLLGTPALGGAPYGALAVQMGMTLPTARMFSSENRLTGDAGVTLTPEVLAEIGGRHARLTFNVGARLRSNETIDSLTVGPELTWGVGLGVPIVFKGLELEIETYGATSFANPMEHATTPVEAIAGVRYRARNGWTVAAGAGPGIARGYGSPDFRAISSVGWTEPPARTFIVLGSAARIAAPQPVDSDHDGVIDAIDRCPHVPGLIDNHGCARFVALVPSETAPVEIVISRRIEFETDEASTLRDVSAPVLEEVRATLQANPRIRRVAVEGHADERDTDEHNMALSRRRAASVVRWLVEHGVDASRLEAHGYGEREPIAAGTTLPAQQANRNVQFFILDPPASRPSR